MNRKEATDQSSRPMERRVKSFRYAMSGLTEVIKTQANFRIHLIVASLVIVTGFITRVSATEWLVLTLTIGTVLAMETLNTALEYLVDIIRPEKHPLAGKVKDVAAGAVLITAGMAAIIGLTIFIPRIF